MAEHELRRHIVPRIGDRPLSFAGTLIAESGRPNENIKRWHEVRIYRLGRSPVLIAAIRYVTIFDDDADICHAEVFQNESEVCDWLQDYEPGDVLHSCNQPTVLERLKKSIEDQYDAAAGEAMAQAGFTEELTASET